MNIYKLAYASKTSLINALKTRGILIEDEEGQDVYAQGTHAVVHLGNIVLERAELDSEGEVIKEAVLSPSYHVDVMTDAVLDFGDAEVVIASGQVPYHAFA